MNWKTILLFVALTSCYQGFGQGAMQSIIGKWKVEGIVKGDGNTDVLSMLPVMAQGRVYKFSKSGECEVSDIEGEVVYSGSYHFDQDSLVMTFKRGAFKVLPTYLENGKFTFENQYGGLTTLERMDGD
ncbi:MAG: hypothetical protein RIE58_04965 [Vicingaceae bacterium]